MNQELQMGFYDFVNQYRITDARAKLADPSNFHYTILGVALDVGFNNKSSFNRAFKKHAGITPSNFIKAQRKKSS
jgi:AraC-like DNA-binding protein